jgi:hypothetical protein
MIPPVPRPRNARPGGYPKAGSSIWEMLKPFAPAVGNAISDAGYGLATEGHQNMFAAATRRGAELDPYRDQQSMVRKQEEERVAQTNATVEWLRQQAEANPDNPKLQQIMQGLEMGTLDPAGAFNAALQAQAQPEPTKGIEINGRLVNPLTGEEMGNYSDPANSAQNQPALVQEYEYAKQQGYQGTIMDYQRETSARALGGMDATTRKELFEAQDAATAGDYVLSALDRALELNSKAVDGAFAGQRAWLGANIPDMGLGNGNGQDFATLEYQNITTELALTQLKTIFGGMPTEGERKILLDLQGSVDKPQAVRQQILERARVMAQRRIDDAKAKAEALRSGGYFTPGYGQQPQAAPGNTTSTGIPWSIEP